MAYRRSAPRGFDLNELPGGEAGDMMEAYDKSSWRDVFISRRGAQEIIQSDPSTFRGFRYDEPEQIVLEFGERHLLSFIRIFYNANDQGFYVVLIYPGE